MSKQGRQVIIVLVLVAAVLRTNGLLENTFHADEALYASWARQIAIWRDPLLTSQIVDKPPLLFYLQALFFPLLGPVMWAARIPNYIASLLLIPLIANLAWQLYRNELAMVLSAAFVTVSPMAIQFSSSGFLDPLMTCLLVFSLMVVSRYRPANLKKLGPKARSSGKWMPAYAGFLYGLAIASKFQALLFMPLLVGLALANGWRKREWVQWLVGLLPVLGALIIWEMLRGNESSLLETQFQSYGGIRLAWSWELWPRLQAWVGQWQHIIGSEVLEFLVLLTIPPFVAMLIDRHDKAAALDRLFTLFVFAYLSLHWFLAIPAWDRYLLPLLPFIGLVFARFIWRVVTFAKPIINDYVDIPLGMRHLTLLILIALVVFQSPTIIDAYHGDLPIGASPAADHGVAEVSDFLADQPYGTVLYDHWYSWQWRYHLFEDRVYISWFPHADALVEDLQTFGNDESLRYLALPGSDLALPIKRALKEAGFSLKPIVMSTAKDDNSGIVLYLVAPK